MADLGDLAAFVTVARAGGFRDGARAGGGSASGLSEAVSRLESRLGVRLLNRTTRSVAPTEAGARLLERLGPALGEVEAALDVMNGFRDRPAGTLRLNVPVIHVDGVGRRPDAAVEFATAHPPGTRLEDKHAFVAHQNGCPVGLLDVIDRYPLPGTAFIGLLAVRESLQGDGLGRALYQQAEGFIRNDLAANVIRLAVVEANPVSGFWKRMGFVPTGEVKPYEGHAVASRSILMEKSLSSCPG